MSLSVGADALPRLPHARLDPYSRALIRWRGEHLAQAARLLRRGELEWEWTLVPRYTPSDSATRENPKPSMSPRLVAFPARRIVEVSAARTDPFTVAYHTVELTPGMLGDADGLMRRAGLAANPLLHHNPEPVWERFVVAPHPPTIFRTHARKGVVATSEVARGGDWDGLRRCAFIWGVLSAKHELLEHRES